jgi:hypothetical protein
MAYTFKKLLPRSVASISGKFGFKKLEVEEDHRTKIVEVIVDIRALGLPLGTHFITATSLAAGIESVSSDAVIYTK